MPQALLKMHISPPPPHPPKTHQSCQDQPVAGTVAKFTENRKANDFTINPQKPLNSHSCTRQNNNNKAKKRKKDQGSHTALAVPK